MRTILLILFLLPFSKICSQDVAATNFEFQDLYNQTSQLTEYRGKVLYVSFWASWCKPCIVNFEKYREIRSQMSDAGVILLNVNVDKSISKWKAAVDQHNIDGDHVRPNDLDFVMQQYNLSSIPYYEIINKKGEVVYLSEDYGRNILEEFKAWVKE